MSDKNYKVHVHQYKNGAILGQIKDNDVVVKEIWQDPVMNPKVTLHFLRKQVEMMVWLDRI